MASDGVKAILNRELSNNEVGAENSISLFLQEIINYSTLILNKCSTSNYLSDKADVDIAVFALYRSIIEITDGIEVLVSKSCYDASIPLVRSSFEILVSLEYILESLVHYEQRSLAWLVHHVHQQIAFFDRNDPTSDSGKETAINQKTDKYLSEVPWPLIPLETIQKERIKLERILDKPHIIPINSELGKSRKWYSAFGGPSNMRNLSIKVQYGFQYDFLYKKWSNYTHAEDLFSLFSSNETKRPVIRKIRNNEGITEIPTFAATFLLASTRLILKKFLPEEDYQTWYEKEIKNRYAMISGNVVFK